MDNLHCSFFYLIMFLQDFLKSLKKKEKRMLIKKKEKKKNDY